MYNSNGMFSFYSHFGKYVQQIKYSNMYKGYYDLLYSMSVDGYGIKGIGLDLKPISTYLAEIGFQWQTTPWSIATKAYYKKSMNLPVINHNNYPYTVLGKLENRGETIAKGFEASAVLNNHNGLSLIINTAYTNGYGPSIHHNSSMGQQYNELTRLAEPTMYAPLENSYSFYGDVIASYKFPNLNENSFSKDLFMSSRLHVNSGHPYNRWNQFVVPTRYYQVYSHVQEGDFNGFTTSWVFQMDLRITKAFMIAKKIKLSFDFIVKNLFDIKNEINLFPRTGTTQNDGYTSSELLNEYVEAYGEDFVDLYRVVEIDYYNSFKKQTGFNLFGPPRQIYFGVTLEY